MKSFKFNINDYVGIRDILCTGRITGRETIPADFLHLMFSSRNNYTIQIIDDYGDYEIKRKLTVEESQLVYLSRPLE